MAYTVPRVLIEQAFTAAPIFANNPLAAFIFGPNYRPLRYTVAAEKAYTYIGAYNAGSGITPVAYPWITANPGSVVDATKNGTTYVNITPYVEDAFAKYFSGGGVQANGTVDTQTAFLVKGSYTPGDDQVVAVASSSGYYTNKIRASSLYFADGTNPTTGAVYSRSAYFSARDVKVGDWVAVSGHNNAGTPALITVFAQIIGIETDGNGRVNTLVTAQRIFDVDGGTSATLLDPVPGGAKVMAIALYVRKNVEMPNSFLASGTTSTVVGVNSGATLTETGLVDNTGVLKALSIGVPSSTVVQTPAKVYVSYRVLRTDHSTGIASLTDPALVEATLGAVVPENPLAEGVYDALLNSSGTPVYYMAVPTDDLAGYNAVLEQAKRLDTIYGLVPLTFDSTVIAAVKAHVETMSTAAEAKWRKVWICLQPTTFGVLQGYDRAASGVNWQIAARGNDPETGTVNVFATVSSASGSYDPALVTNGVRAGDTLRVFADTTTTSSYVDYVIAAVRSQNELVTTTPLGNTNARAVQILRTYTNDEQVAALGAATGNSRRVNAVFPYIAKTAGVDKAGYFVAAALAGLRAGSLPHAPLTNVEILGFDDFTVSLVTFTPTQLNNLASYGYWIVTQDVTGGTPYVRHQLTTLGYNDVGADPKFSEDSITTNVDSISYALQRALKPFIGRYNVNPATIALINSSLIRQFSALVSVSSNTPAGPQLLGYEVKSIGKSSVFKDRIEAVTEVDLPYPLNGVTITLVVP